MILNVWITGVGGFTGRHLVMYLRKNIKDIKLVGIDVKPELPGLIDEYHRISLNDKEGIKQAIIQSPPDLVFNLAGLMPPSSEPDMWQANVSGTISLLQSIGQAGLNCNIVTIGSAAEYVPGLRGKIRESALCPGNTAYGRVKWAQTTLSMTLAKQFGLNLKVARPFNLIGPGLPSSLVAGRICAQFSQFGNKIIKLGNIKSKRDFVDVRDAVSAYWEIARYGKPYKIYNVCTENPISIGQLVDIFRHASGKIDAVIKSKVDVRLDDNPIVYGSSDEIRSLSGWQPGINLMQSVTDMLIVGDEEKRDHLHV